MLTSLSKFILLIDSDYEFDILYAVRESKLPCEVIDFLTGDKTL